MSSALSVLVIRGGPDREREVSLQSGANVARALRDAGHHVTEADLQPNHTAELDRWLNDTADQRTHRAVWPVLHGKWGEGGGAQKLLEAEGVPFVGCGSTVAAVCFDKQRTKEQAAALGIRTIPGRLLNTADHPSPDDVLSFTPLPAVIKPNDEGSSIDLALCQTPGEFRTAWNHIAPRHRQLLVERLTPGKEVTVGMLQVGDDIQILPPIWIRPATAFYDYEAKYTRDDTRYEFDLAEPPEVLAALRESCETLFRGLGVRHLCRIDFIIDAQRHSWLLEVNTMPGFTGHSLLPMAARQAGHSDAWLCDAIVRAAL
jgi:D-alanine-D-alanine ligase